METKYVDFKNYKCEVSTSHYKNGRVALLLSEDGQPITVATVNLPDEDLKPNEVAIKNYSENEGILDALIEAGIVESPHDVRFSGFVIIPICRLKIA